ncbi:MAG: restriction endonuclease [Clostridia bacterium]|nr:restriction endonuclease [Clostridia bacterium]
MAKEQENKTVTTRAEKKDAAKKIILELLGKSELKSNALIDEAAKQYAVKLGGGENENPNDVKGRIGSVLDVMKKDGEVSFEGGMYALKRETPPENAEEKPKKTTRAKAKKKTEEVKEEVAAETAEEKPVKAKRTRKTKAKEESPAEEKREDGEERLPLPASPLQPIAPVVPVTPEVAPEPMPEDKPKKRATRKAKTSVKSEEIKMETAEEKPKAEPAPAEIKAEEKPVEASLPEPEPAPAPAETKTEPVKGEEKKEEGPKGTLMDMSFLFGDIKPVKREEPKKLEAKKEPVGEVKTEPVSKTEAKPVPKAAQKPEPKAEEKPVTKAEQKPKQTRNEKRTERSTSVKKSRALTADEKLQEAFLKKLHRLGGDYFEYYSVYLLERYSRMNGRRLEALKITGGDRDGGIDGEIELTDGLGFRETIYIQAKNWDPDKGDEKLWVVGETLLQQFIGACVCRQAKDGKQHCRGIFITTSRFTPEAKRLLDDTADKFVGYDANDLFEAAKECQFGIVKKNGEWVLDDELLSGEKAFFKMF